MAEPQRLQSNPMYKIIDAAIRKDITWHQARERLRELVQAQPELFRTVPPDVLEDLELDDP